MGGDMNRPLARALPRGLVCAGLCGAWWLAAAAATAAHPQPEKMNWAPSVGLELGHSPERLRVQFPEETYTEDRALWNSRLSLGLDGRLPRALGDFDGRSVSELSYGFVHHTGHGLLEVSQSGLLEYPLGGGFALPFGLAVVGTLDTSSSARSGLGFGLPLGVRFRAVELWYRPAFLVPLGSEDEAVFTGTRELSMRPGLNWLDMGIRVRLAFLGF